MQTTKIKPTTIKKINKIKVMAAKSLAYVLLIVSASYGLRNALSSLEEVPQLVITGSLILALVFIISLKED